MYADLISIIEGAAPTIAAALMPVPFKGAASALATVAIAHLADGLGLPHPADKQEIINKISEANPAVANAVLSRADANFQSTLASVAPATPAAPEPIVGSVLPIQPAEYTGVTSDLPSHIVYIVLSIIGGGLATRGIDLGNLSMMVFGSHDLWVGSSIIAGSLTLLWRDVIGTNRNTKIMASATQP